TALGPAVFDRHVPALDVTGIAEALAERGRLGSEPDRRFAIEEPDHLHRRLLRARRKRPRGHCAAEERDEGAPSHSITSSARSKIAVGNSTPIARAVLRLTTSSKFEACSTGRSAALAPLKILATYAAMRRYMGI